MQIFDIKKNENIAKIFKMSLPNNNWDGNNEGKFDDKSIDFFKTIINGLERQPDIAPTNRGTLYMQYERRDNSILAFEIACNRIDIAIVPDCNYSLMKIYTISTDFINVINKYVHNFYSIEFQNK